jgi:putative ABC transport system permease protein
MNVLQTTRVSGRALLRNKLRSFLTALGIIIGVGAVIAMVSIGEGAKAQVEASFASMGSDLLIVLPGSTSGGGVQGGFGSAPTLSWDDLRAIGSELPAVRAVAPALRSNQQIVSEEQNWTTSVTGTSVEYFEIRSWPVSRGALFTSTDVEAGAKVALLGETVVEKLWNAAVDPVGQSVRIKNTPYTVVGVLARKGQSPQGQDFDDAVFIPYRTFQSKVQGGLQKYLGGSIFVGAKPSVGTAAAGRQVSALLRDRHRLADGADDDFSVRNLTEMANAQQEGTKTLTSLLAAIALVSLLVGGIGIMNIMLVSVTERTREIGVRMAVGARPASILAQFLLEALMLSIGGGLLGVAVGIFAARMLAAQFGWPMLIRMDIVFVSVGFSAAVGVVFGLYPAQKASRLDPISALRFE